MISSFLFIYQLLRQTEGTYVVLSSKLQLFRPSAKALLFSVHCWVQSLILTINDIQTFLSKSRFS